MALLALLLAMLVTAAPAQAQDLVVADPAGDQEAGLDVTRARLANNDYAVRVRVRFSDAVRGTLVVSIDRRKGSGLRLVSRYRSQGQTRSFVLRHAFTDRRAGNRRVACRGLRVAWDAEAAAVTLRLPSRCFHGGDYGAVRFAVLTERGGGDSDVAPETESGDIAQSAWIPRG